MIRRDFLKLCGGAGLALMTPAALTSPDFAFRAFGWTNIIFFTGVVFVTVKYHHKFKK